MTANRRGKDLSSVNMYHFGSYHYKTVESKRTNRPHISPLMHMRLLNYDTLLAVFENLPPFGLLSFSRTSKDFRRILMDPSSISVWKASFAMIDGIPDCPENLSLPSWANLVYGRYCNHCLASGQWTVNWVLQVRLCTICVSVCLFDSRNLIDRYGRDRNVIRCVPFVIWGQLSGLRCLKAEADRFYEKYLTSSDRQNLVECAVRSVATREDHGIRCSRWARSVAKARRSHLSRVRVKRADLIYNRLRNMDFGEDLTFLMQLRRVRTTDSQFPLFHAHKLVNQCWELTATSWNRITARMISYITIVQHHRLARHRLIVIHERQLDLAKAWCDLLRRQPIPYLVPRASDLSHFSSIRSLLHAPNDSIITRTILDRAVSSMEQDVSRWRSSNAKRMLNTVKLDMPIPLPGMGVRDQLRLATCVIMCISPSSNPIRHLCRTTKEFMWYPQFFDHCCNHIGSTSTKQQLVDTGRGIGDFCSEAYSLIETADNDVWNPDYMVFNKRASSVVQHILTACGVNHQEASVEDVDALDIYVLCMTCYASTSNPGTMTIMTWRRAVRHGVHKHDIPPRWERLNAAETLSMRKTITLARDTANKWWYCAVCRYLEGFGGRMTTVRVLAHLHNRHNIDPAYEGTDYYRATDVPDAFSATFKHHVGAVERIWLNRIEFQTSHSPK